METATLTRVRARKLSQTPFSGAYWLKRQKSSRWVSCRAGLGKARPQTHNASASYCVFSWFLPPLFLLKVCIFYLASGWAGTTGEKKMAVAQIFLLLASCHRQWIQSLDHWGKLQLGPQKRKSKKVIANQPGHMAFRSVWAGNFNRWENKITSLKGRACQKLGNPQAAEIPGQKNKRNTKQPSPEPQGQLHTHPAPCQRILRWWESKSCTCALEIL